MSNVKAKAVRNHGDGLKQKMALLLRISDETGQTIIERGIISTMWTCFHTRWQAQPHIKLLQPQFSALGQSIPLANQSPEMRTRAEVVVEEQTCDISL